MKYPFNIIHSFFMLTLVALMIPVTSHSEEKPVLGYNVYGSGSEKVIVLHDWMGDSANYEPAIPYLDPATFTWVFVDVRGYGLSKHLAGKYTVEEVASDVFHLADSLSWQRFHVVGHSMNGMTVQRMAIHDRNLSEQAFSGLTGKKLLPAWSRIKSSRNAA